MAKVAWVPKIEALTEIGVKSRGGKFVESGKVFSYLQAKNIANRLNRETFGADGGYIVVYC